ADGAVATRRGRVRDLLAVVPRHGVNGHAGGHAQARFKHRGRGVRVALAQRCRCRRSVVAKVVKAFLPPRLAERRGLRVGERVFGAEALRCEPFGKVEIHGVTPPALRASTEGFRTKTRAPSAPRAPRAAATSLRW